ncbi:hypothetical protein U9M48_032504 [Paspalum notatum var. saurae]|uniref:non-specific serine/threonine protein kinase n=1 Tax=Paspalum notatum var. saurae TaxID=547442 RepID=A0AAQ3U8U8_PASNO
MTLMISLVPLHPITFCCHRHHLTYNKLISSSGRFALGFLQTGSKSNNTLNWYLGIWYNKVPNLTQVWVANGDSPLTNLTTSELTISNNGNLVILNQATESIVWSTKSNTTTNNTVAILLNCGNLVLQDSTNSSEVLWQSFDYPTERKTPFHHLCNDDELFFCNCMKGFSISSTKDWELDDRIDGCMRNITLDCVSNKSTGSSTDKFYSIPCVRLPHNAYNIEAATSAGNCKIVCLCNCSCTAYSWGNGGCLVWYDELLNVKQQQCNDVTDPSGETLFLRLSAKEKQSHKSSARRIMMATSLAVSFAILFSLALAFMILWKKRKMYSFTLNKSQGEGGFGSVYKGFLFDSTTIAVKRLDGASQGEKQFRAEVSSIGDIQHINLVKLLGLCCSSDSRLLVYEYMSQHSLDIHLFPGGAEILNWNTRYQIALGIARGLTYLHESCRDCIIHCDVKPQNILLDESFVPKIADFGMAKFLGRDFSRALTTIRGTIGYLAPEWISGEAITSKVDVYSYGMLLLEIVSGRRNSHIPTTGDDATYFPVQVASKLLVGDIASLVDHKLRGDVNLKEAERACKIAYTLRRGHALAGSEKLVSRNGKFALGFFQTGRSSSDSTLNSYLGIWFHEVPVRTPVWAANRDNPVSSSASPELIVSGDGNLAVLAQGAIIWSTQANITANDTVAVLLDNGNLVLRSSSSNSSITFWESFDYPTDIQLPGAKIGWDKVTGMYSWRMDLDGISRMFWNSSVVYWSSGEWNGKFFSSIPEISAGSSLANFTFVNNDQEVYFSYTIFDENMIILTVLDVSGQNHVLVWTGQDWIPVSSAPNYQCDVYAVCGPFTVCIYNANPYCNCMKGFSVRSPEDWELEDKTGGCIRNTPLNCGDNYGNRTGMTDKFYSVTGIRLPNNGKIIPDASSAGECEQVCLSNCSCTAYSYTNGCSIWHDDLVNAATDGNGEMLYLRLAAKELESRRNGSKGGMIIGVAIGASITTSVFILLIVIWRRKRKWPSSTIENDRGSVGIITFRYVDLLYATKRFSEKLGAGGFGSVFKGCLSDSIAIAVKRLDGARQGEKQFRAEVNSIGIIQHINLVKLIGFCCEGDRRLLVYEHMPNGSLDSHLFRSNGAVLGWTIRYQIALGIARGLAYLHHGCRDCIIHCDVKPQNILLDASFIPKIADFGMAKFLGREFSRVVTTTRGTIGYLAPEWISGTAITSKVDVYSYGMVLLEIVSGKMNYIEHSASHEDQEDYFPVQVGHKLLHGDILSLVDADLHGDVNMEEVERVCKVACWCIQDSEFDRPTMVEVVQFLEGICQTEMPPVPRKLRN